jgi:hypothetical protein
MARVLGFQMVKPTRLDTCQVQVHSGNVALFMRGELGHMAPCAQHLRLGGLCFR